MSGKLPPAAGASGSASLGPPWVAGYHTIVGRARSGSSAWSPWAGVTRLPSTRSKSTTPTP